ncbi:MAG: hypothetical protein H0X38_09375 [Planctomycetes bacterium]|nr:hypothetical protein [Planctomycetota bacterium]
MSHSSSLQNASGDQATEMDEFLREATALAQRVNQRLREQSGSYQSVVRTDSGRLRVSSLSL